MKNVLIIEDDESNRRILEMSLRTFSCSVQAAVNGEEGLSMANAKVPDLIIMDMMMPKLNGLQILDVLRRSQNLAKVPVIVVSAKAAAQDEKRALDAGANHFLTKPFRVKDIQAVVSQYLPEAK